MIYIGRSVHSNLPSSRSQWQSSHCGCNLYHRVSAEGPRHILQQWQQQQRQQQQQQYYLNCYSLIQSYWYWHPTGSRISIFGSCKISARIRYIQVPGAEDTSNCTIISNIQSQKLAIFMFWGAMWWSLQQKKTKYYVYSYSSCDHTLGPGCINSILHFCYLVS